MYTGISIVNIDSKDLDTFYKKEKIGIDYLPMQTYYPNQCIVLKSNNKQSALGIIKDEYVVKIDEKQKLYDLTLKNKEQRFAASLLKDPDIHLLCFSGISGGGKTLLSLAYAMELFDDDKITSIILLKNPTPVGRDLGALPGSLLEKVRAWSGSFLDNMEVLGVPDYKLNDFINEEVRFKKRINKKIEILPFTYMQGRSINNSIIIADEFQNTTKEIAKQLVSRAGENTKVILMGDPAQVFEKGLTKEKNGLVHVIETAKTWKKAASLHFIKSERSELASWAWENL